MVRIKKKGRAGKVFKSETDKRVIVVLLLLLAVTVGGVGTQFAAFGPSSDWGIDVEIMSVGYASNMYGYGALDKDLPSEADVLLKGNRIVTLDYDGEVNYASYPVKGTGLFAFHQVPTEAPGMYPRVSHAVGQVFYTDEYGNKTTAPRRVFVETGADIGDVHYYYGFSVMFTTRAEIQQCADFVGFRSPYAGDLGWISEQLLPIREIPLSTEVGIRVQSLTDTFAYEGSVNDVHIINERARYTLSTSISGVDQDMQTFNNEYEWLDINIKGLAESGAPPLVTYNVIDSEDENLASLLFQADLRIGADSALSGIAESRIVIDTWNREVGEGLGYEVTGIHNVYNVEYIYDVMVDVSINGVTIADFMANWSQGTSDGLLPVDDPEVEEFPIYIVIIIAIIAVIVLRRIL